jgi:hypothetical protein
MCYAYKHVMKAITYLAAFTVGAAAMVSSAFSKELEG